MKVPQSCLTLCDTMDCSMPGFPIPHHLLKFAQVHVHCIGDAIQPSHPLSHSSPSALNLSQHQELFQWVMCSHQMTNILELQLQYQSFEWYSRLISLKIDWFDLLAVKGTLRSLLQHHSLKASIFWCPWDFQESFPTPQFEGINSLAFCFLYSPALTAVCDHWEDHSL